MKRIAISSALLALSLTTNTQASDFAGPYIGANLGYNIASTTSLADKKNGYLGLKAGYNWDWNSFLLGAEGFVDTHSDSYTGQDAGLDARLGLPMDRWMPYAKLGLAATAPGNRLHGGLGVEYSLTDRWAVNAEWTTDSKDDNGITKKNNNIAVGLNLRWGAEPAEAAPVPAVGNSAQQAAADKAAADAVAAKAAADKAAADKAAKAAADKAVADTAAKAAAAKAAADSASKVAEPAYKTLLTDKPVTLEGASFASGSAKLNASAHAQLDDIVKFAIDNKEAGLTIVGYTDNRGNAAKNVKLSAARAAAVKAYLVSKGVAADRVTTKGAGSADPIGDNKTDAGRAQNRRVEIKSVITEVKRERVQLRRD